MEDVLCLTCGGVLRRERDSAGTPNGGPAFQWFDLAGAVLVGANWLDQRQLQRTLLLLEAQRQAAMLQLTPPATMVVGRLPGHHAREVEYHANPERTTAV